MKTRNGLFSLHLANRSVVRHQHVASRQLEENFVKDKLTISTLLLVALFLTLTPNAVATTTWYVSGVRENDSNNCKSPTTACKTIGHAIGHAIAPAHSGDTIMVASATYTENLTINITLKIVGSGAQTTIVDGGTTIISQSLRCSISSGTANVTLSKLTVRNGSNSKCGRGRLV